MFHVSNVTFAPAPRSLPPLHPSTRHNLTAAAAHNVDSKAWQAKAQAAPSKPQHVDAANSVGWTALFRASIAGNVEEIHHLLQAGACVHRRDSEGFTPLMRAAQVGHPGAVIALLEAKADSNAVAENGVTALMLAAHSGSVGIIRALVAYEANVYALNALGASALIYATQCNHVGAVQALIDARAKVDADDMGMTAMELAVRKGHADVVGVLARGGACLRDNTGSGPSVLLSAASDGRFDVVQALMGAGVDIDAIGSSGATALMWAARQGQVVALNVLLQAGADIHAADSEGWTAISYAVCGGHSGALAALLRHHPQACANVGENPRVTALMVAAFLGRTEMVPMLLDFHADIDARDAGGETALMAAAGAGHADIVNLLLEKGADIGAVANDGSCALTRAQAKGHTGIADMLERAGHRHEGLRGATAMEGVQAAAMPAAYLPDARMPSFLTADDSIESADTLPVPIPPEQEVDRPVWEGRSPRALPMEMHMEPVPMDISDWPAHQTMNWLRA